MIDFKGCLENVPQKGEYKKFRISIEGYYYWGDGYRTHQDYEDFEKLMNLIEDNIDSIFETKYGNDITFAHRNCTQLISTTQYCPVYIYFHPMEFTGILKENDINNLCEFVSSASQRIGRKDIEVRLASMEDTYHLDEGAYINLIYQNADNIIERVQNYINRLSKYRRNEFFNSKYKIHEVGYDFAKTCRIQRDFGELHAIAGGYSSNDPDIVAVINIVEQAIQKGLITNPTVTLKVYARDTAADELYNETDNYTNTSYIAKLLPNGELDLEDLTKNMIEKGWLSEYNPNKMKVVETESTYLIYVDCEPTEDNEYEFYVKKETL
ncbi:MAG: hypothetical protein VZS44_11930 [Bacilli bacterium]|nr:hypothetical protein [Bacilli bacterium]